MRDLLIVTPTRRRKAQAQRLIDNVAATATAQTDLILAIDDDDLGTYAGLQLNPNVKVIHGPRKTCVEWSNQIAAEYGSGYRTLASFGDDHVPETPGWDSIMLAAIDEMGGTGIVYGDDTLQHENLPTAPVMSSDIPAVLGWFFLPQMRHFFCDDAWKAIGQAVDRFRYLPQVIIRHYHYAFGTALPDSTYAEAGPSFGIDEAAFDNWRRDGLAEAAEKVRVLLRGG